MLERDIDSATMLKVIELYDKEVLREREDAFRSAMVLAQREMVRIAADKKSDKGWYATLAKIDRELRPIYTRHGFSLTFDTEDTVLPDTVSIICDVSHDEGHTRRYRLPMPIVTKGPKGNDVMTRTHATAAAVTYARRNLTLMIFNIAIGEDPTDDDGNGGSPLELISDAQAKAIYDKLEATGGNLEGFLSYMNIASVEALPAADYEAAVLTIEAAHKRRQQQERDNTK